MLAGCYGFVRLLHITPGHSYTLLLLMGVLQIYELLLVGLAWLLITHRWAERDGRILLLLELVFLADTTFLNVEYSNTDPDGGVFVSLVTLFLVFIKVGVMLQAMGLGFALKTQIFLLTQFGALLGIPLLMARASQQNQLSDANFYSMWWLVGVLPIVQYWMVGELDKRRLCNNWLRPLERNFRIAIIVLPFASVFWHALSMHWVYDFPFYTSYLTPLVLGLGLSGSLVGRRWISRAWCFHIRWTTPLLALLFSLNFPDELLFSLKPELLTGVVVSPFRIGLLAVAAVYFLSFLIDRRRPLLPAGTTALLMAVTGNSLRAIVDTVLQRLEHIVPKTPQEWCLASIVCAFAFLALGAAVSFSQRNSPSSSLATGAPGADRGRPGASHPI